MSTANVQSVACAGLPSLERSVSVSYIMFCMTYCYTSARHAFSVMALVVAAAHHRPSVLSTEEVSAMFMTMSVLHSIKTHLCVFVDRLRRLRTCTKVENMAANWKDPKKKREQLWSQEEWNGWRQVAAQHTTTPNPATPSLSEHAAEQWTNDRDPWNRQPQHTAPMQPWDVP